LAVTLPARNGLPRLRLEHPDVWATVALHPNAAAHDTDLENSLLAIAELAKLPQVRGLGETGLDYYRTEESQAAAQHVSFRAHIDIAREVGKPVIIHDRDAHKDVIEIFRNSWRTRNCSFPLLLR